MGKFKKYIYFLLNSALSLSYALLFITCIIKYNPSVVDNVLLDLIREDGFYFSRVRNTFLFLGFYLVVTPLQAYIVYIVVASKNYGRLKVVALISLIFYAILALVCLFMAGISTISIPTVD